MILCACFGFPDAAPEVSTWAKVVCVRGDLRTHSKRQQGQWPGEDGEQHGD